MRACKLLIDDQAKALEPLELGRPGCLPFATQVSLLVRRWLSGAPKACPGGRLGSEHYHRVHPAPGAGSGAPARGREPAAPTAVSCADVP